MLQVNVDLGVFQETKVIEGVYMQDSSGYRLVMSEAPSAHSGGVIVFYHTAEHFSFEALQLYGANVVRFQLADSVGTLWGDTWPSQD